MAEKFKQDTFALTKLDKGALGGMEDYAGMKQREDEALERLMREQAELEGDEVPVEKLLSDVVVEGDDDEDMPDWAIDDEDQASGHAGVKSDTKRNLLLEVSCVLLLLLYIIVIINAINIFIYLIYIYALYLLK